MTRQQTAPDPLADLRQPEPAGVTTQQPAGTPSAAQSAPEDPDAATAPDEPGSEVHDTAWHQDAASSIVERWHGDMVARAQMHGGGTCGCRYAANLALVLLYGPPVIAPEPEPEPAEEQP